MRLYTFLPEDYINDLTSVSGEALREAKAVLAWEATALTHGEAAADAAVNQTRTLFVSDSGTVSADEMMEIAVTMEVSDEMTLADIVIGAGLATSRNEVRRLAAQGGLSVNGERIEDVHVPASTLDELLVLRAGKKRIRPVHLIHKS